MFCRKQRRFFDDGDSWILTDPKSGDFGYGYDFGYGDSGFGPGTITTGCSPVMIRLLRLNVT